MKCKTLIKANSVSTQSFDCGIALGFWISEEKMTVRQGEFNVILIIERK